jgi:hypothetical protein
MENSKENIKLIFKALDHEKPFVEGCVKYFKKNKKLSDKQFQALLEMFNNLNKKL